MKYIHLFLSFFIMGCESAPVLTEQTQYTCIQYDLISQDSDHISVSNDLTISNEGLVYEWRLKQRKTPENLMLAVANIESNNHIHIFRFEKRLNMVSCGLFQVLKKEMEVLSIQEQMNEYDNLMYFCMNKAKGNIKKAIFYYNSPYGNYKEGLEFVERKFKRL